MATIAKGMITLVNVNDAYTVSATPNVCAIKADFDGTNPVLEDAYCDITVVRGDIKVPFTIKSTTSSHADIQYSIGGTDATKRLALTSIPVDALSGTVTVEVATEDEFVATVIFQYSVMREATMLDWIKDWENNKTTIGNTYLITPKLFVGKKVEAEADLKVLTGVYIGPDSDNGAGIYGYKEGVDIFHINENGGMIGGWEINNGGIQTQDGTLKILSEGSIISSDQDGNVIWGLYKSGSATFAKGNVKFHIDGTAEFAGTVKSSEGEIGGWYIGPGVLRSDMMCLDSNNNYIGVAAQGAPKEDGWDGSLHIGWVALYGGVYMHYMNSSEYGIRAYLPQTGIDGGEVQQHKTFSLGSTNLIAGWNFDDTAIWIGNKINTAQQYTSESGSITIGTNGLRGNKWFIDSNGDMSFMGGKIKFTATDDGGEIVGWKLNPNRFSTNNVALVSDGSVTGLYMSANENAAFNSLASSSLENYIDANGGIYMNINDTGAEFAAYNNEGKKLFKIKSDDVSSIAGWNFDNNALYTGTKATSGFTTTGSITFGPTGIRGYKWRLENDGSGAIAGGNITWDAEGNVTFTDSVKIGWNNLGGTIINSEGVFAGKISADNITAGTISTANVKNATGTWALNQDGSGYLANKNIIWDTEGALVLQNIDAQSGKIAGFRISGTSLTNDGFDNDACIIFRNDTYNVFGAMGGNTLPASSGLRAVARFENNDSTGYWFSRNIALILSAQNGTYNHAFMGTGNGTLNGWIGGYRFDRFTLTTADTIYGGYVNLKKNNRWLCKSTVSNAGISLPTLNDVQNALGIGDSTPFCVDLYILSDIGTSNYYIYGRTDRKDSSDNMPWRSEEYPVFIHYNGGYWERQEVAAGDCFHVWLIYDPDETQTINNYTCKYTARIISIQT